MQLIVFLYTFVFSYTKRCVYKPEDNIEEPPKSPTNDEELDKYWDGSCEEGGTYSINEFGANICEYPGTSCPIVKYFTYQEGGRGVELCCDTHSDCNYDPVKNYCHPDLKRCVDGSYFGCSEKAGPIFDFCK